MRTRAFLLFPTDLHALLSFAWSASFKDGEVRSEQTLTLLDGPEVTAAIEQLLFGASVKVGASFVPDGPTFAMRVPPPDDLIRDGGGLMLGCFAPAARGEQGDECEVTCVSELPFSTRLMGSGAADDASAGTTCAAQVDSAIHTPPSEDEENEGEGGGGAVAPYLLPIPISPKACSAECDRVAVLVGGALVVEAPLFPYDIAITASSSDLAEDLNGTAAEEEETYDTSAAAAPSRVAWSEAGQVNALGRVWWAYAAVGSMVVALWPMAHQANLMFDGGGGGDSIACRYVVVKPKRSDTIRIRAI